MCDIQFAVWFAACTQCTLCVSEDNPVPPPLTLSLSLPPSTSLSLTITLPPSLLSPSLPSLPLSPFLPFSSHPPPSLPSSSHQADYRGDGKVELICCSVDGEVRGYLPSDTTQPGGVSGATGGVVDHWKKLETLTQRKQVRVTAVSPTANFDRSALGSI